MVVHDVERLVQGGHHAVHERFDGAGSLSRHAYFAVRHAQARLATGFASRAAQQVVMHQLVRAALHQILRAQRVPDLLWPHLALQPLGQRLHHFGELDQHGARQRNAEVFLQHEAHAAFAGLAVHAHRLFVGRADVGRIDRQVRHLPAAAIHPRHAFLDGVLVGAGERGEHQVASVGMAFVNRQLVDGFHGGADARHVAEIQLRVHALREEVHRHGHEVAVAGALAVAEQRAFHPLGTGHERQFGGGHAGAAIIVGVQADHDPLAAGEAAGEPLDLVGVHVGRRHLHRGRQVDDDGARGRGAPLVGHRSANLHREVQFRAGETLRRVLEHDVGIAQRLDAFFHHRGALHGQIDDAGAVHVEHHAALQLGGGVVEVEDGVRRAVERFHGAFDELGACLAEHLHGDVLRHHAAVDDAADEVVVRLRRRRKAHLDFHETDFEQQLVHAQLFVHIHRVDQRLVAIAQVHAAPARRFGEGVVRPLPIRQRHRGERTVLGERHGPFAAPGRGRLTRLLRVHRNLRGRAVCCC